MRATQSQLRLAKAISGRECRIKDGSIQVSPRGTWDIDNMLDVAEMIREEFGFDTVVVDHGIEHGTVKQ